MVTPEHLIIFNALALTLPEAALMDLSRRWELGERTGHRLALPLIAFCKAEKNFASDTHSRSGNHSQLPLPEARAAPRLHVQFPWQEAPPDHGQAQGWGSEFFFEGENQDSHHISILLHPTGHQMLCKGNGCQKLATHSSLIFFLPL